MASEYLKKKYQDVKPDVKVELTPEQKRKNWWDYHKWYVAIGAVLVCILGGIVWDAVRQVKPDYIIAYVGEYRLPEETAAALEAQLSALGEDLNGDGRTTVSLREYTAADSGGGGDVYAYGMASQVQIMADLESCESYFFLLEDPEEFQRQYGALGYLDGTLPPEGNHSAENTYLLWADCPVLAGLPLGGYAYQTAVGEVSGDSQELLAGLAIARRGFWTDRTVKNADGCAALWDRLTEGARS